jgi:hypothetical protein
VLIPDDTEPALRSLQPNAKPRKPFRPFQFSRFNYDINRNAASQEPEMEFTIVELGALILITLWGLVAMRKLLQQLSAIARTLQEIRLVLQDGRKSGD